MKRLIDISLLIAASCAAAAAQAPILTFAGRAAGDNFGSVVRTVGDTNGDGYPDYAFGAPLADDSGWTDAGILYTYSGRTALRLRQYRGDRDIQEVGCSVAGVGDLDGDGKSDLVLGSRVGRFRYPGETWVTSGGTGRIYAYMLGEFAYDYESQGLAGAGDVDNDGYDDFAVGAPGRDDNGNNSGRVRIFAGKGRAVLRTFFGAAAGDEFGAALAAGGDVDGDGWRDLIVGSPRADAPRRTDSGRVDVISGKTGLLLFSWFGDVAGDRLGTAVGGAGDVNHDGYADVIAGAPLSDAGGTDAGQVKVWSGRDGALLYSWNGSAAGDAFGAAVAIAGDVDGDGHADLLVGAPMVDGPAGIDAGRATLYSGATGAVLHTFDGANPGARLGASVDTGGDVDHDGYADVLIGAPGDLKNGVPTGRGFVYSLGGAGSPPRAFVRGVACIGADRRLPRIEVTGRAALGESYGIQLYGARRNAVAVMNLGVQWDQPLVGTCTAYAYPLVGFGATTDGDGFARVVPFASLPVNVSYVGVEMHHQWLVVDPAANALGISASNDGVVIVGQ